jgi:ABC-type antimicrobial peptide transport system permease subunit
VEKGIQPENLENTDENHSMIYLGYAYKDIPVGTVYSQNYYGTTYEYEVAGILKKGQRFLSEDVLLMTTDTLQVYDNLDYAVLVVDDEEVFSGQGYIAVKKGMESEALALIDETAEKYSITYQLENLTPLFEEVKEENLEFIKQTAAMTGFMLILSIFLMGRRQMIYILKQQREFAVLYAQGVSEKDLLTAILMETLQRMLAAFLLVMFTIWILGRFVLDGTSQLITSMTDMLMHSVYPELAVIMFAVGIISVIIPLVLMHRKMPVDLLRED